MQHAQSRLLARKWIGRGALASLAALIAAVVLPALPALAGSWSAPVQLPGSCGSSVAENQAGAMAAGGTFQAADGSTHVQLCTSPDGKTWQAADLGQGGSLRRPVMAVDPSGRAAAVWGSYVGCPAACGYIAQAAVHPAGGSWGAPVTLSTYLQFDRGGPVLGVDGAGNALAVFGSSFSWHLTGGGWGAATSLPAGSSGGLAVADPAGTFVYADSSGNAFTFAAGAVGFGTGSGSRGSLDDLKIVPGRAVMLAAGAVSAETVT